MRTFLHSGKRPFSLFLRFFVVLCATTWMRPAANASDSPPAVIAKAVVTEESEEQIRLVRSLAGDTDLRIRDLLTAWKEGGIFIFEAPEGIPGLAEGQKIAVVLTPEKDGEDKQGLLRLDSGEPIKDGEGKPLRGVATDIEAAEGLVCRPGNAWPSLAFDVAAINARFARNRLRRALGITREHHHLELHPMQRGNRCARTLLDGI
jgi:hypothetical protein